jgi:hypothetical protein
MQKSESSDGGKKPSKSFGGNCAPTMLEMRAVASSVLCAVATQLGISVLETRDSDEMIILFWAARMGRA